MTLYVHPVEVIWIVINLTTVFVTVWALREAYLDYLMVKRLNGKAREIATLGDMRRAGERIIKAVLLTVAAVPTLFIDNNPSMVGPIGFLTLVPLVMLYGSVADVRERRRLVALIARESK